MSLPIRIKNVRYKVAGKYAYKGDIIVTDGILYYFPHTDLIQQRINRTVKAMSYAAGGVAGGLIRNLELAAFDGDSGSLLHTKESNSAIQERLDAYIDDMKKERSAVTLSTYLPIPIRYTKADIKNLSLTLMGSVSFEAHYDTHFYNVGLARKKVLRASLSEAGFI
jgi:hypothetical protein